MTHMGPERVRQWSQREGSVADFLGWRARGSWPALVIGWFFIPPASIIGAGINVARGDMTSALGLLAIGAVALAWLFLPVLSRRYLIRRSQPDR